MAAVFQELRKDSLKPDEQLDEGMFRAAPRAWNIFQSYFQKWVERSGAEKHQHSLPESQTEATSAEERSHRIQLAHAFQKDQDNLMTSLNSTVVRYLCRVVGSKMGSETPMAEIQDLVDVPVDNKVAVDPILSDVESLWTSGNEIPALACTVAFELLSQAAESTEDSNIRQLLEALEAAHFPDMVSHRVRKEQRLQPVGTSASGLLREDSEEGSSQVERQADKSDEPSQWVA